MQRPIHFPLEDKHSISCTILSHTKDYIVKNLQRSEGTPLLHPSKTNIFLSLAEAVWLAAWLGVASPEGRQTRRQARRQASKQGGSELGSDTPASREICSHPKFSSLSRRGQGRRRESRGARGPFLLYELKGNSSTSTFSSGFSLDFFFLTISVFFLVFRCLTLLCTYITHFFFY